MSEEKKSSPSVAIHRNTASVGPEQANKELKPDKKPLIEKKTNVKKKFSDPWKYLKFVHMTEKSIGLVEKENKLIFMVERRATKKDIKNAFEKTFDVKVDDVNIMIDQKGRKKAFIKLSKDYPASDIAMRLGVI